MLEILNAFMSFMQTTVEIAEAEQARGLIAIGAGIAVFTGVGAGISQGIAAAKLTEVTGRNPEAAAQARTNMIVGAAVAESTGIYGLVIAILLIFVY